MEQGCFCLSYLVVTLDQKAIATTQTNTPFEKVISSILRKIDDVVFFSCDFSKFYASQKKINDIFGILRNSDQETCVLYIKILI